MTDDMCLWHLVICFLVFLCQVTICLQVNRWIALESWRVKVIILFRMDSLQLTTIQEWIGRICFFHLFHLMSRWWQLKYLLLSPRTLGKMNPIWRAYFSDGLVQPPTSISCSFPIGSMYGIVSCIYHKNQPNQPNVGIDILLYYTWYGMGFLMFMFVTFPKCSHGFNKNPMVFFLPQNRGPSHGSRARRSHPFFRSLARRWVGPVSGF